MHITPHTTIYTSPHHTTPHYIAERETQSTYILPRYPSTSTKAISNQREPWMSHDINISIHVYIYMKQFPCVNHVQCDFGSTNHNKLWLVDMPIVCECLHTRRAAVERHTLCRTVFRERGLLTWRWKQVKRGVVECSTKVCVLILELMFHIVRTYVRTYAMQTVRTQCILTYIVHNVSPTTYSCSNKLRHYACHRHGVVTLRFAPCEPCALGLQITPRARVFGGHPLIAYLPFHTSALLKLFRSYKHARAPRQELQTWRNSLTTQRWACFRGNNGD